jgi:hypothetical protein
MKLIYNNKTIQCEDITQLEKFFNCIRSNFDSLYSVEIITVSKEDHQIREMIDAIEPIDENDPRLKAIIDKTNKDLL